MWFTALKNSFLSVFVFNLATKESPTPYRLEYFCLEGTLYGYSKLVTQSKRLELNQITLTGENIQILMKSPSLEISGNIFTLNLYQKMPANMCIWPRVNVQNVRKTTTLVKFDNFFDVI